MEIKKISIIGLGLIGGSLAKALRSIGFKNIAAVDTSYNNVESAIKDGVITRGFSQVNSYIYDSEIIFICTPVKCALKYIDILKEKVDSNTIVTDVCSTKGEIISYVNQYASSLCFIGGHPMAGTEKTGYASGFAHLFENAYYILTPSKKTTEAAINVMVELVKSIGGIPVLLNAEEHDRITGCISHVPHIIASALVNLVKSLDSSEGKMQMLAAGGFKDITRIASSNPEMWENIILSNKKQVKGILSRYINTMQKFVEMIDSNDSKQIYSFFESAKNYRNALSSNKKSLITPTYEIIVDVVDEPGIIGKIATILGKNNINIKNINVSNSREFEEGCLRITLPCFESVEKAYSLLKDAGYKVYKTL